MKRCWAWEEIPPLWSLPAACGTKVYRLCDTLNFHIPPKSHSCIIFSSWKILWNWHSLPRWYLERKVWEWQGWETINLKSNIIAGPSSSPGHLMHEVLRFWDLFLGEECRRVWIGRWDRNHQLELSIIAAGRRQISNPGHLIHCPPLTHCASSRALCRALIALRNADIVQFAILWNCALVIMPRWTWPTWPFVNAEPVQPQSCSRCDRLELHLGGFARDSADTYKLCTTVHVRPISNNPTLLNH